MRIESAPIIYPHRPAFNTNLLENAKTSAGQPCIYAIQNSSENIGTTNNKKTNAGRNILWPAGGLCAFIIAGISLAKKGKIKQLGVKPDTLEGAQSVTSPFSNYILQLAEDLGKLTGRKVVPESLSSVLDGKKFLEQIKKLRKENYVLSDENIKNGIFRADLHSHSVFSDGKADVETIMSQVADYADKLYQKTGEKFLYALTDHDGIDGVKKVLEIISSAPEKFKNVKFVIGSEISFLIKSDKTTNPLETAELLVYGFNPFSQRVNDFFRTIKDTRLNVRKSYIKDLSDAFPDTKFSENEFCEVFLGERAPQNPMMNSYWQLYHYGQLKKVLSDTAKAKNLNPEDYFRDIITRASEKLNVYELKKQGLIEDWINESPKITEINDKYRPYIDKFDKIRQSCENTLEDIYQAFKNEDDCSMGLAHPYYITERTSDIQGVFNVLKTKLGSMLKLCENYHQAYSNEVIKNEVKLINEISHMAENRGLVSIGGRDNHGANYI